jgi:hypothetical protein
LHTHAVPTVVPLTHGASHAAPCTPLTQRSHNPVKLPAHSHRKHVAALVPTAASHLAASQRPCAVLQPHSTLHAAPVQPLTHSQPPVVWLQTPLPLHSLPPKRGH